MSNESKIELFRTLFIGRNDVYAKRWENKSGKSGYSPVCKNEWVKNICNKKQVKCQECSYRDFKKVDDAVIKTHLQGKEVIGTYAMLQDETCWFLAIDFDDGDWQKDVTILREVCKDIGVMPAVERSRSGEGAHMWFFFSENISCYTTRKFASSLLTYAMNKRHEIKFTSYDKFFPNQDTMPKGGLGNLIALPLQMAARKNGNSVFVDEDFVEYPDQWVFLSEMKKLTLEQIENFTKKLALSSDLGSLQYEYVAVEDENNPWENKKKVTPIITKKDFPHTVSIIKANMLYIPKKGISPTGLNHLKRLAAFKNPEFYKAQAMRLSTHQKPRIISISDETADYILLPRGLFKQVIKLLDEVNINKVNVVDKTNKGLEITVSFNGQLREEQETALMPFLENDIGVLSATTAFGKTVLAAKLIAERKTNTLILVHRTQLLQQWRERLAEFLTISGLPVEELTTNGRKRKKKGIGVGQLGGGKDSFTGVVDIAVMQSLVRKGEVKDIVKNYGMIIVDECHHVSAYSFEQIIKFANAKYVYGLTATPSRQDGHHPIIFMHCGEILYKVDAKEQAKKRPFEHVVIPRFTSMRQQLEVGNDWSITDCYSQIQNHETRNNLILQDVLQNISEGRNPIILTERTAHVELFVNLLRSNSVRNIIPLVGGNSEKRKRELLQKIDGVSANESIVIVATGKYVGEGFDLPRLDTLFLAMPISWKGTLSQYAGRLHRLYEGKNEVRIYDYVDIHIPMLEKMYQKRLKGYASIGYKTKSDAMPQEKSDIIFDRTTFEPVYHNDILTAKQEVIIVSPFLTKRRIDTSLTNLTEAIKKGVHIKVITRPSNDYNEVNSQKISECIQILEEIGVKVITKSKIHQKFAIVDHTIAWYGSINLLSYGISEESMMRLESTSITLELGRLI